MGRITLQEMEKYLQKNKEILTPAEEFKANIKKDEQKKVDIFSLTFKEKPTSKTLEKQVENIKDSVNNSITAINDLDKENFVKGLIDCIYESYKTLNIFDVEFEKAWNNKINNKKEKFNYGLLNKIIGDKK